VSEQDRFQMPEEAVPEFNAVHREVLHLHSAWKLYTSLYSNPDHIATMKVAARGAFGVIQRALLHEILMAHGRLLDPAEERDKKGPVVNLSLERLVNMVKDHCQPEVAERFTDLHKRAKAHCKPIVKLRHKRVGHLDRQTVLAPEEDPLPKVEREEVEQGLEMLGELVNEVQRHFTDAETPFRRVFMQGGAEDLMFFLRAGLDAQGETKSSGIVPGLSPDQEQGQP
jgi:hypothetical protein